MRKPGFLFALPLMAFMLVCFALPMVIVAWFSLMPSRTFSLAAAPSLDNYRAIFSGGYERPLMWSLIGASLTVMICTVLAWPTAKILHLHAGRWVFVITALIALPIFISESVRLFGMSMFLMPGGGILAGTLRELFDIRIGSVLNTRVGALLGMIFIHFPFMLFPTLLGVAMIPADRVDAAYDLGAGRWAVFREIELPLAMPGLLIGGLLTFVLCIGANAEAAILGGRAVTVITAAIESRFNYAQDWPVGAALTMVMIVATALIVFPVLRRIDLNRMIRR